MTRIQALRIRQVLFGAMMLSIALACVMPAGWGGLAGFAAIGFGAAFFWRDRCQVRPIWREIYEHRAMSLSVWLFVALGLVLFATAG